MARPSASCWTIPRPGKRFQPSATYYSKVYGNILDFAVPSHIINIHTKDAALAARHVILDPKQPGKSTKDFLEYRKLQNEVDAAADALSCAQADSRESGKPVPAGLAKALKDAQDKLAANRLKDRIEKAQATIQQELDENMAVLFTDLRDKLSEAETGGTDPWYPLTFSPPLDEVKTSKSWHPWSFHFSTLKTHGAGDTKAAGTRSPGPPPVV